MEYIATVSALLGGVREGKGRGREAEKRRRS